MKWILYGIIYIVMCHSINAQRMIPGQIGLELQTGILKAEFPVTDYFINAGVVVYKKNGNYLSGAIQYNAKCPQYKDEKINHETFLLEAGYMFYLLGNSTRSLNLNAGIQGAVGYEFLNRGEKILYDGALLESTEDLIYGAGARLSLEKFILNQIVLLLQGQLNALWGTTMEMFRPSVGMRIRYNF